MSSGSSVRAVDLANQKAQEVFASVVEGMLALRDQMGAVPDEERRELKIQDWGIDHLSSVVEPLHAKV